MTSTLTQPPTDEKPWVWTSLGTAALIVLCCGIAPVAVIAGIGSIRDSPTNTGGGGAVVARASQHPTPRASSPLAATPPPTPPATPSPVPTPTPSPHSVAPAEEPQAIDPLPLEPEYQAEPVHPVEPTYPAQPVYPVEQPPMPPNPAEPPPVQGITLPLPVQATRIGDIVRTGGLEFVVRGVQCGVKQVGTEARGQQALGQFCVVSLSIRNIGELIQNALDTGQTAIGANGSVYSISSLASLIANEAGNQAFLGGINPGQEVSGVVVFELPDGIDLTQVVLPGGIKVDTR